MNSLESEFSFLAPTWRLPQVATTSMYGRNYGSSYLSNPTDFGPDRSLWDSSIYNSRYISPYVPPSTIHRNYLLSGDHQQIIPPIFPPHQQNYQPPGGRLGQSGPSHYQQTNIHHGNNTNSEDGLNLTISVHPNNGYESHNNMPNYGQSKHQTMNRGLTYSTNAQNNPPPQTQRRRVQIIDNSRQTPSTVNNDYISDRSSHNSNKVPSYSHVNRHTPDSNKSQHKPKPPVSNQYHDHNDDSRRSHNGHNQNIHEYLYGLSTPDPGSYANAFKQQQRRLQEEKVGRKSVISDYRNFAHNGGFGPTFGNPDQQTHGDKITTEKKKKTYSRVVRETNQQKIEEQKRIHDGQQKTRTAPVPKSQRPDATRSHFLSTQEAREYADKIEKPQHMRPVSENKFPSIIVTPLSNTERRSSLDSDQSLNLYNSLSDGFLIDRPRRSSSLSLIGTKGRVRFRSRDFIRRRSSTVTDLPSHVIGKSIPCQKDSLSTRFRTKKSVSNSLDEKNDKPINNIEQSSNRSLQSTSYKNEKKIITSHSMIMAKNMKLPPTATVLINQTHKPSLMTPTSINNISKKSISNKDIISSQRPITVHSIPGSIRKRSTIFKPDFDIKVKSYHQNTSSNE